MNEPQHIYSVRFEDAYGNRPCYIAHIDSAFGTIKVCNDIRRAATFEREVAISVCGSLEIRGYINPHVCINGHVRNRLLGVADMRGIPL